LLEAPLDAVCVRCGEHREAESHFFFIIKYGFASVIWYEVFKWLQMIVLF